MNKESSYLGLTKNVLQERSKYMKEYGLFKFRIYSYKELKSFMGLDGETNTLKKILTSNFEKYYQLMNPPLENEWLMTHKEYGQTHLEFIRGERKNITAKQNSVFIINTKVILVQKLNKENENDKNINEEVIIDEFDPEYMSQMLNILKTYYSFMSIQHVNVSIYLTEEEYIINSRGMAKNEGNNNDDNDINKNSNEMTNRSQINGTYILWKLNKYIPSKAYCAVALLNKDMYHNDKDGLIETCYELRNIKKRISIISTKRFYPLFYYKPITIQSEENKKKIESISFKRHLKLLIRNIGLMFRLANCIFFQCPMNGFNYLNEFDGHPIELCPICLVKLFAFLSSKSEGNRCQGAISLYYRLDNLVKELSNSIYKDEFVSEINWYKQRFNDLTQIV